MRTIDLSDRTALIFGVANQRSLAWSIAQSLGGAGCRLAFTYAGDRLAERVQRLASEFPGSPVLPCDVTDDAQVDAVFERVGNEFGRLDFMIHSIAFAPKEALAGAYHATTRDAWRTALEISAFSLVQLTHRAVPLMQDHGGSIVTLSFQASHRIVPNYNVMGSAKAALEHAVRQLAFELGSVGIRVNCISAGPVHTLSARGIAGFSDMFGATAARSPMRRNVEATEIGDAALFLCSDLASGVTGETLFVDAGFHIMA